MERKTVRGELTETTQVARHEYAPGPFRSPINKMKEKEGNTQAQVPSGQMKIGSTKPKHNLD